MADRTRTFYDTTASRTARNYEAVDFRLLVSKVLSYAPEKAKLLDVGCGSGRDAAFYLEQGYDVTAIDGSRAMLREAERYHPELSGRLLHHELPERLPFDDGAFDIVTSMAVIMHLWEVILPGVFLDIARVTRSGGILAYSVNTERAGLDENGNDDKGRHFTCLSSEEWEKLHVTAGLETLDSWESDDITGRPGIRWATFVCRKR